MLIFEYYSGLRSRPTTLLMTRRTQCFSPSRGATCSTTRRTESRSSSTPTSSTATILCWVSATRSSLEDATSECFPGLFLLTYHPLLSAKHTYISECHMCVSQLADLCFTTYFAISIHISCPQLLWTLGLHSCRMHRHGDSISNYQPLWLWMLHRGQFCIQ